MKGCRIMADAGTQRQTIGLTLLTDTGQGVMDDCFIEGEEAVNVGTASQGTIFKNSTLVATALALDDTPNEVYCSNMNFISDTAAGGAAAPGCLDWDAQKSANCFLTASATHGAIPVYTAHA